LRPAEAGGGGAYTGTEIHRADFVVLAGGARNQLLPNTTALGSDDLEMTLGYFVPTEENILKVKFSEEIRRVSVVVSP
jgi:hypothetical protein